MKMDHGLSEESVAKITAVLSRFPAVERALLFGSRAKGTFKPGSDIDLALVGPELDWRVIGKIDDALDDLLLPYGFSLIIFSARTDPEVSAHIQRVGRVFYEKAAVREEVTRQ